MIDYEVDLYDELARMVLARWPEAYVSSEYAPVPGSFPAVSIVQSSNVEDPGTVSSADEEEYAAVTWTVQVAHPSKQRGRRTVREIVSLVSDEMRRRNMGRTTCMPVDNADDPSICRMVARFTGVVRADGTTYRR